MTNEEIGYTPATQLAEMIRRKQISPTEVMRATLDRITALEPKVNAFAYLAARTLKGLPISFPGTTGAPSPMTGGVVARP